MRKNRVWTFEFEEIDKEGGVVRIINNRTRKSGILIVENIKKGDSLLYGNVAEEDNIHITTYDLKLPVYLLNEIRKSFRRRSFSDFKECQGLPG